MVTYYYRVRAYKGDLNSDYSNIASVATDEENSLLLESGDYLLLENGFFLLIE